MANNNSLVGGQQGHFNYRLMIVQILVVIFLCINLLLIITFFSKDLFHTSLRYILFAVTLLSDSIILTMSDILLILNSYSFTMQVGLCVILYILSLLYIFVTPVTLTAMTLERYVAICMPLRHTELCSMCSPAHCILIIHGLSTIPCIVVVSTFFATSSSSLYTQYRTCSMDIFVFLRKQNYTKLGVYQCYFLIMGFAILFSYIEIVKVAKAASGENKKSTWKGLKTVIFHAFQLFLCLFQLWCPFIETALLQIDLMLYVHVRFFNYITFILAPRCLSPLIYGLRDEKFCIALKYNVLFGFHCVKNNAQVGFV